MKKMRIHLILLFMAVFGFAAQAQTQPQHQHKPRFDAKRFQADMEQFIASEAGLSPQEAASFFPIYREMMKKQRALFVEAGKFHNVKPADEAGCREAIEKVDRIDMQIKELQQEYHRRFMKVLSPSKVYDVLKAEQRFHRQALKKRRK